MRSKYDAERIRGQLRLVHLAPFFRIIKRRHMTLPLGAVAAPSRFGDPEGKYAVLYASEAVRCSFWEAVARNRFTRRRRRELPRPDVEERLVVSLETRVPVTLIDLRGDGPIRIAAPTAVAHDTNHVAGRALSSAAYADVPEADGFIYHSRFTGHACAAVFDRAIVNLQTLDVAPLSVHVDFLDALVDYDITLTTPPS